MDSVTFLIPEEHIIDTSLDVISSIEIVLRLENKLFQMYPNKEISEVFHKFDTWCLVRSALTEFFLIFN